MIPSPAVTSFRLALALSVRDLNPGESSRLLREVERERVPSAGERREVVEETDEDEVDGLSVGGEPMGIAPVVGSSEIGSNEIGARTRGTSNLRSSSPKISS